MNKVYIVVNFGFGAWSGEGDADATPCATPERAIAEFEKQMQETIEHYSQDLSEDDELDYTYHPAKGGHYPYFKIEESDRCVEIHIEEKDILA
jgi:hypothetical protein